MERGGRGAMHHWWQHKLSSRQSEESVRSTHAGKASACNVHVYGWNEEARIRIEVLALPLIFAPHSGDEMEFCSPSHPIL